MVLEVKKKIEQNYKKTLHYCIIQSFFTNQCVIASVIYGHSNVEAVAILLTIFSL